MTFLEYMNFMYHGLVLIHDVFKYELENKNYVIIIKIKLMIIWQNTYNFAL